MNTDKTQDAAEPYLASAGSQLRERISEIVYDAMRFGRDAKTPKWQGGNSDAESRARQAAWQIATLIQPAITDEEREAVAHAVSRLAGIHYSDTLRGLLERTA